MVRLGSDHLLAVFSSPDIAGAEHDTQTGAVIKTLADVLGQTVYDLVVEDLDHVAVFILFGNGLSGEFQKCAFILYRVHIQSSACSSKIRHLILYIKKINL